MEISKLSDTSPSSSSRLLLPADIYKQLSQLGSIEARVASISKGQAMLISQLGQILSANTLDLKVGDLLRIRADGNEQTPILKVSKLPPQAPRLNIAANQSLAQKLAATKPVAALVVSQRKNNTFIQIDNQLIKIQAQPDLKPGQLISLEKSTNGKNIEIRLVNHQQVLKSAVKQLLPQQAKAEQPTALTQLVKLIQGVSLKLTEAVIHSELKQNSSSQTGIALEKQPSSPIHLQAALSNQTNKASDASRLQNSNLFSQLEALTGSLPQLSKLDKTAIQQWVHYILVTGQSRSDSAQATLAPYQLLQQFPKLEASVSQQLKQWAQLLVIASQSQAGQAESSTKLDELLLHTSREVIKLAEQSIGQQLLQKTNLRYQQELQQPIAFNIAIPLNDQQKIQELRLKIRQNKNESEPDKQSWDIHLDFEFGLLGLISTHLLLDEGTLSATFWSSKSQTQQIIDSNLSDFMAQISRAGFNLGQFHSFPGKPPATNEHDRSDMPETLLDIRV